ncbi:hypothetical protein ABAC460_21810 [Asticcacaulis sp. AC460]|uniref:alpha/beta hydrolase family protein n=1 Tax=Asticcacaulis sp. AC460 TaxID=1282360 RepID=UPI0003C3BC2B|nr:S9 family peptidase [Asticcacaulis sp. AC460]ESQ86856.1 hypothetical protein ABAC460_21810 [Asticcacaulis sp. AC460]
MRTTRPSSLNRRALFRIGGAAAAVNLTAMSARADEAAAPSTPMPPVEAFAAPPAVDEVAISPDGTRCAIVSQMGEEKTLLHFRVSDAALRAINLGPAKVRGLMFGDNDHVVVVSSVTIDLANFAGGNDEFSVAHAIDLETTDAVRLFANQKEFYNIIAGDLNRIKVDGEYRVTASNYRILGSYNLCLFSFDMAKPRSRLIHEAGPDAEGWVVAPDGYLVAFSKYDDQRKLWSLHHNLAGRGKSPDFKEIFSVREPLNTPVLVGQGRDGQSVIVAFNAGEHDGEYRELSPDGTLGPALDNDGGGRSRTPLFHPATGRLAGFSHHDDWLTYDYFDPLLTKIVAAAATALGPDYRVAIKGFAEDPRKLILYGESPKDAGSYYYADFSTGQVELLAHNYPLIPEAWISQKTPVSYRASDGLEIHGYLTLPPFRVAKNLPLVVLPHGGPQARDNIGFDWQAQALASRGYAVLQPNFRGSSGYGEAFVVRGHGEWGRRMQTDLSDGVRWLASQGTIDPRRVAIMGASYGGYAALAGATLDAGAYRCAVSIAGVSELNSMLDYQFRSSGGTLNRRVRHWQQFTGDRGGYDDISPARQAAKAYCPILLIHGTDDTVVPIDQSKRMERALKEADKPVEFITYKGQDHWETVGSHRIGMMASALAFLEKHNPA